MTVWGNKVRGVEKARRCSVRCAVPVGLSKQGNERTYILFYCCLNFQINTRLWIRRACWATCNLFFFFTALTDFGAPKFWRPWIGAHFTLVDVWPCQYWDSFFLLSTIKTTGGNTCLWQGIANHVQHLSKTNRNTPVQLSAKKINYGLKKTVEKSPTRAYHIRASSSASLSLMVSSLITTRPCTTFLPMPSS